MKKTLPTLVLLLAVTLASAQIDIFNGLQGHYTFNGGVTDATSNHYDGTLHGQAHVNGYRLILGDNPHDFMAVPPAVVNGLGDFTIAFHVAFEIFHVTGANSYNQVLSGYGPDLDGLGIAYNKNTSSWVFTVNGESVEKFDPTVSQFSLLCFFLSRQGDSLKLFIDANQVGSWQINANPISIENLVIGQHATCADGCFKPKQCLAGRVENLAFWNRALTLDEIDYGCHPPHTVFDYFNVNCTNGAVDFVNSSEHSDYYSWDFGDGNSSNEIDPEHSFNGGAGTYTVTLVSINQWNHLTDTLSQEVIATNTTVDPGVSADGSTTICDGSSVMLNATPADAASYQWSVNGTPISGATNSTYTATEGGDYSVSVTNATGCSGASGEINVSINTSPVANVTPAAPVSVCEGNTQIYSASTGIDLSYQWMKNGSPIPGATNSHFTANNSGNYSVVITNSSNCSSVSNTASFTVNENPAAVITPDGSTTFCDGGSVSLSATEGNGYSYQWWIDGNSIGGATNSSFDANQNGNYAVTVTTGQNCSANSDEVSVTVNSNPIATIDPSGAVSACAGSGQSFSANTGVGITYQWTMDGSPISGATDDTYSTSDAGSYSVIETNSDGCSGTSESAALTVNANPEIAITPDGNTSFCDGSSVVLTAEGNGSLSYQWKKDGNQINGETNSTYTATTSGSYTVKVTDQNGCKNSAANVAVTVNENPTASISPSENVAFCEGASQTYTANSGVGLTYQWTMDGDEISGETNETYSTNASGSYAVIVWNANGCSTSSASSTLTVNANPAATITIDGSTTFCEGSSVNLTGTSGVGYSYQWKKDGNNISGETNMDYTATGDGNYTVKITDMNGCKATSAPVNIIVDANPVASIDPSGEAAICEGTSQMYMANIGDLTYQWTWNGDPIEGETNSMYTATSSGSYEVITWNEAGCSSTSSASELSVNANPVASIDPSGNVAICEGASQMYMANIGDLTYQWTWNGDPIEGETNSTYTATSSGTYAVITWNESGCSATSSSSAFTVNATPEATIDPSGEVSFCEGGSQTFNTNGGLGLSYQWTLSGEDINGATNSSYSATGAGSYAVVVTNDAGCSSTSSSSTVIVNAAPEATITANGDLSICQGKNVELTANTGLDLTYQWQENAADIPGATSDNYLADEGGSYTVLVTNLTGCSTLSTALEVEVNPLPEISLGEDLVVCDTDNYVIDAGAGFESYLWNDGSESQTIPVSGSGDYWVIVTDATGCGAADTVNVTVEICSGIDEVLLANAINIYPNPTFGVFAIEINMPAVDNAKIDLVNTLGQYVRSVYEGKLSGRMTFQVDGNELSQGVYFVKMNIGDNVVTKKVIITE